jgi:hypothetical protein
MIDQQQFRARYWQIAQERLLHSRGIVRTTFPSAVVTEVVHATFERLYALLGHQCTVGELAACADLGAGVLTLADIEQAYGIDLDPVRQYEAMLCEVADDELVQFAVRELGAQVALPL